MKSFIADTIKQALDKLGYSQYLSDDTPQINRTKCRDHGDFAANIALVLAKAMHKNPRDIAQEIVAALSLPPSIRKVDIAGPGFINFFLAHDTQQAVIETILTAKADYGSADLGQQQRVHLEFVSANPTGPLHVGHGRSAAYGSALANLLRFADFDVYCEYYVNDAGRQMDILTVSVWLRYLNLCGEQCHFPSNAYQGDYVIDIAQDLFKNYHNQFYQAEQLVFKAVPTDQSDTDGDKEAHIDGLITNAKQLLGEQFDLIQTKSLDTVLQGIQQDLSQFQVDFDLWFSEKTMRHRGAIQAALARLQIDKRLYQRDGATWFRATDFGDDKDRVAVRDNGQTTYFAADAAYLLNKMSRGFERIVCILGADHHGYVPRLQALRQAYGLADDCLLTPLIQFAVLYRHGKKIPMSTRSGQFVTLRQLCDEVGKDAARYFYLMRKPEQHLDFDLDLAKSQSNDNPVYYIQYAYARICSLFRQLEMQKLTCNTEQGLAAIGILQSEHEVAILTTLAKFPELIATAAQRYEPHLITHYLHDLAQAFHRYYNVQQFIIDTPTERNARLVLLLAIKQVIVNALTLLGIHAPEKM